jgi:hypothetical protein
MKIVSAQISPMPKSFFDPTPSVCVTYEDGSSEKLFSFYPDEISFYPREFIGLTREQALGLRHGKDVAYLRS